MSSLRFILKEKMMRINMSSVQKVKEAVSVSDGNFTIEGITEVKMQDEKIKQGIASMFD